MWYNGITKGDRRSLSIFGILTRSHQKLLSSLKIRIFILRVTQIPLQVHHRSTSDLAVIWNIVVVLMHDSNILFSSLYCYHPICIFIFFRNTSRCTVSSHTHALRSLSWTCPWPRLTSFIERGHWTLLPGNNFQKKAKETILIRLIFWYQHAISLFLVHCSVCRIKRLNSHDFYR